MTVYPKTYSKEEFLKFLEKNNVNDTVIAKFVELPEEVVRNGNTYELYIGSAWYSGGNTHYSFELNYYSVETIEYLFSSKVFNDIEISINNLTCELMGINCFKANK